jgi:hypothetical protein
MPKALVLGLFIAASGCVEAGDADGDADDGSDDAALAIESGRPTIFANAQTGKCLDAPTTWIDASPPLTQLECNGKKSQQFMLYPMGSTGFGIHEAASGKCVDLEGTPATGYRLRRTICNLSTSPTNTQRFSFGPPTSTPAGTAYELISVGTGLCVDVPSGVAADGLRLRLAPCSGGLAQMWRVL